MDLGISADISSFSPSKLLFPLLSIGILAKLFLFFYCSNFSLMEVTLPLRNLFFPRCTMRHPLRCDLSSHNARFFSLFIHEGIFLLEDSLSHRQISFFAQGPA